MKLITTIGSVENTGSEKIKRSVRTRYDPRPALLRVGSPIAGRAERNINEHLSIAYFA
jgi:hypothetical protein